MVPLKKFGNAPRREDREFLDCVQRAMERRLTGAISSAEEIAARLNVSPEEMQEMLRKQGTSLEQITAQVLTEPESYLQ